MGHKPFETLANDKVMRVVQGRLLSNYYTLQVLSAVSSGVRLAPPPGCPRKLYSIMIDCW